MKYAVVRLGGKQFKIKEGTKIEVERQKTPLQFDVLFYSDNGNTMIGNPIVEGITVSAKVIEEKLDEKIRVARFKSKSRYRKVKGHRQPLSVIEIEKIGKGTKKVSKVEDKAEEKPLEVEKKTKTTKKEEKVEKKKGSAKKTATKKTVKSTKK